MNGEIPEKAWHAQYDHLGSQTEPIEAVFYKGKSRMNIYDMEEHVNVLESKAEELERVRRLEAEYIPEGQSLRAIIADLRARLTKEHEDAEIVVGSLQVKLEAAEAERDDVQLRKESWNVRANKAEAKLTTYETLLMQAVKLFGDWTRIRDHPIECDCELHVLITAIASALGEGQE